MSAKKNQQNQSSPASFAYAVFKAIASLQLAVVLMVLLGCILAAATFVEKAKGMDYVQWTIYHSTWFIALQGVLAVNVIAAMLIRFPWGFRRIGFLLTHVGILMVLAGALWTYLYGIEGSIIFAEGETVRQYIVPKEDKILPSGTIRPASKTTRPAYGPIRPAR